MNIVMLQFCALYDEHFFMKLKYHDEGDKLLIFLIKKTVTQDLC